MIDIWSKSDVDQSMKGMLRALNELGYGSLPESLYPARSEYLCRAYMFEWPAQGLREWLAGPREEISEGGGVSYLVVTQAAVNNIKIKITVPAPPETLKTLPDVYDDEDELPTSIKPTPICACGIDRRDCEYHR